MWPAASAICKKAAFHHHDFRSFAHCHVPRHAAPRRPAGRALLPLRRKMEGPRAAGGRGRAEPGHRLRVGADQRLEPRFLRCAAGQKRTRVLDPVAAVHVHRDGRHPRGGLQVLSHAAAAGALARLDDAQLPHALARQPDLLPARTGPLCTPGRHSPGPGSSRQPGPAHPGRPAVVHRLHGDPVDGRAEFGRDAGHLHRHPVGLVGPVLVRPGWAGVHDPGVHGVGRADLLRGRHGHHALHRAPADRAELSSTTL